MEKTLNTQKEKEMKHIITTTAILLATASIAAASPANNSDPLADQLAAAQAEIAHLKETIAYKNTAINAAVQTTLKAEAAQDTAEVALQASENQLDATELELESTEAELETTEAELETTEAELSHTKTVLTTTQYYLDHTQEHLEAVQSELTTTNAELEATEADLAQAEIDGQHTAVALATKTGQYQEQLALNSYMTGEISLHNNKVTEAKSKDFSFGNVLQSTKDAGTYRSNSYDKGSLTHLSSSNSLSDNMLADVSHIMYSGKYHNFTIETDLRIENTAANRAEFTATINEIEDVVYNEGYKDGFNDGYEVGYVDGYQQSAKDIGTLSVSNTIN